MRHNVKKVKLGTSTSHTKAVLRNLMTVLLENGSIQTTEKRAKALKSAIDRLLSKAVRQGGVTGARTVGQTVFTNNAYKRFSLLKDKLKTGGSNVRITKIKNRKGDNAVITKIELITS